MKRFVCMMLLMLALCVPSSVFAGDATLSWTGPTLNTDGSAVDDLAGYKIYRGFENITGENYDESMDPGGLNIVPGGSVFYHYTGLGEGEHFFRVKSYDLAGNHSEYSNEAKKNIVTIHEAVTDLK